MQKKSIIKNIVLVAALMASVSGFAGTRIALGGGVVNPNYGELPISVTQLKPGVAYTMSCGITSTGSTKMHFAVNGAVFNYANIPGKLNNTELPGSLAVGANGNVNQGENTFTITTFTRSPQFSAGSPTFLRFLNLDDTVVETVHDCYADVL